MIPLKLLIRAGGGHDRHRPDLDQECKLWVNGRIIYEIAEGPARVLWGWSTFQIDDYEKGIQHHVRQYQWGDGAYVYHNVAFIMWAT